MSAAGPDDAGRRERFEALYSDEYASIYGYVYRRLHYAASEVPDHFKIRQSVESDAPRW